MIKINIKYDYLSLAGFFCIFPQVRFRNTGGSNVSTVAKIVIALKSCSQILENRWLYRVDNRENPQHNKVLYRENRKRSCLEVSRNITVISELHRVKTWIPKNDQFRATIELLGDESIFEYTL